MVNEVSGSKGVGVPQLPSAGYYTHRRKEVNSVFDKDKPNNDGVVKKALDANQEISERMHDLKAKNDYINNRKDNIINSPEFKKLPKEKQEEILKKLGLSLLDGKYINIKLVPMPEPKFGAVEVKPFPMPEPKIGRGIPTP